MGRVSNNWSYEGEMAERAQLRSEGIDNQCAIIGDPDYAGRLCPADGVSQCNDCPFKDTENTPPAVVDFDSPIDF